MRLRSCTVRGLLYCEDRPNIGDSQNYLVELAAAWALAVPAAAFVRGYLEKALFVLGPWAQPGHGNFLLEVSVLGRVAVAS